MRGRRSADASIAERSFFECLRQALGDEFHIFAKVRLRDLVYLPPGVQDRQAWTNRVCQKHVDFVLCGRQKVSPLLVIELDDKSHEREDVQERDTAKDTILHAAGLPIFRVPARRTYSTRELREVISGALGRARQTRQL